MNKFLLLIGVLVLGLAASCKKEEPPKVLPQLSVGDFTFLEGNTTTTSFEFKVTINAVSADQVSVSYKTEAGTAVAGEDFLPVSNGNLVIPPGQTSGNILISVLTDELSEGDEIFEVEIFDPVNAVLADNKGTGTIRNDDTQLVIDDTGYSTPTNYTGYDLIWQDEFNGTSLNLDDWTFELGDGCPSLCGWGNNEEQYYTNSSSNCYFQEGYLVLEAKKENAGGKSYTSSRIKTEGKKFFKFGRVDIRAKLPEGRGVWPALWMLPNEWVHGGWPTSGEIDIMELVGHSPSTVHGTCHYGPAGGGSITSGNSLMLQGGQKYIDEFHVFSIVWVEDKIQWYIDDVFFHEFTPAVVGSNIYPFNENFYFLFNVAVGGNWPGSPDSSTNFPQRMIVDYIRVFQTQ